MHLLSYARSEIMDRQGLTPAGPAIPVVAQNHIPAVLRWTEQGHGAGAVRQWRT